MQKIETIEALTELYSTVNPSAIAKVSPRLTPLYRRWIEAARFCILSTVGPDGVHGSPRGDDGPVVVVKDETTVWMPDWRGNNRLDCLRDIVEDGRIALLFMINGTNTTVRVNGRAWLTDDAAATGAFEQRGKHPATVIVIDVSEIYTQCAKALIRSDLWNRPNTEDIPTVGQILADMSSGEYGGDEYDRTYSEYAQPRMW